MRVTNNIYVLSGSYYGAVNDDSVLGDVYAIKTPEGLICIDCGIPEGGWRMMQKTLDDYGLGGTSITHLILTHAHFDHCGSAKAIQDGGAKVIVGQEDAFQCKNGGSGGLYTPFDLEHVYPAFTPDIEMTDDCTLPLNGLTLEFIKTPGHTPGSMMVRANIDGKTVLFSGDALQPGGGQLDTVSLGWTGDVNYSRASVVKSMMKLLNYETDMILPGHGKVCLRNGTRLIRLAAKTAFLELR